MSGTLYVCATPIGNLEDITLRALRVLRECDAIACEDTRHSAALFFKYDIKKPLIAYHEHNEQGCSEELLNRIENGQSIVLVTDAGMPCISDPGYIVVKKARERGLNVTVLPGASAGICALVLSGMKCDRFVFEGFLPKTSKERKARLEALKNEQRAVILHESPHHLEKTLEELSAILGSRKIAVAREITKLHEECLVFPLNEYRENLPNIKGEFVLVLDSDENAGKISYEDVSVKDQVSELLNSGMDKKTAVKTVAQRLNKSKNEVYMEAIDL